MSFNAYLRCFYAVLCIIVGWSIWTVCTQQPTPEMMTGLKIQRFWLDLFGILAIYLYLHWGWRGMKHFYPEEIEEQGGQVCAMLVSGGLIGAAIGLTVGFLSDTPGRDLVIILGLGTALSLLTFFLLKNPSLFFFTAATTFGCVTLSITVHSNVLMAFVTLFLFGSAVGIIHVIISFYQKMKRLFQQRCGCTSPARPFNHRT